MKKTRAFNTWPRGFLTKRPVKYEMRQYLYQIVSQIKDYDDPATAIKINHCRREIEVGLRLDRFPEIEHSVRWEKYPGSQKDSDMIPYQVCAGTKSYQMDVMAR